MDAMWINFFYNPLLPIGILISLLAVLTFLVFLRGFLSGVMYLFTLNGNDEFLRNARIRVVWAFLLLVLFFGMWEMIRWVTSIITGAPTPEGRFTAHVLLILLGITIWWTRLMKKYFPR